MDAALLPWSVEARNLPEYAGNPIHTDAGALAAGFPSALVAGVTTYAYLTHPAVAAWGREWVERGGGEVRFRAPVFAGERVDCAPRLEAGEWYLEHAGTILATPGARSHRPPPLTLATVRWHE